MNKTIILIGATIFGAIGSFLPSLFGDNDLFSGWSLLGGFIGGLFGIWVGVQVNKRIG